MSPRFVVHRHEASHLHWDLRLERGNILKSWAIPKEPPTRAGIRRLAIEVEDHDLSFIDFEGGIPEGKYGAGRISIWDAGTYDLISETDRRMKLYIYGKRLSGGYVLIPTKGNQWIFFKIKNQH